MEEEQMPQQPEQKENTLVRVSDMVLRYQFIRYCVSGSTAALVDISTFYVLTQFTSIYFVAANVISFVLAASVNYTINRLWTFKSTSANVAGQFITFCTIGSIGLLINTGVLFALVTFASMTEIVAKVLVTGVVLFWNYFMNKHITFKKV